jgi:hypothetical protein
MPLKAVDKLTVDELLAHNGTAPRAPRACWKGATRLQAVAAGARVQDAQAVGRLAGERAPQQRRAVGKHRARGQQPRVRRAARRDLRRPR